MGNIAGDTAIHKDITIAEGVVGLILWAFFSFLLEYVSIKSSKLRVILDGEPTIVIKKGKILEHAMAKQRLNIDDLTMLLRTKDIFSIKDIEYAILEPNGEISILRKSDIAPVTKKDIQ
jgi:uncharacterized membrane protein YcaP (DUF421 family)